MSFQSPGFLGRRDCHSPTVPSLYYLLSLQIYWFEYLDGVRQYAPVNNHSLHLRLMALKYKAILAIKLHSDLDCLLQSVSLSTCAEERGELP